MNPGPQPELLYSHGGEITRLYLSSWEPSFVFQLPNEGVVTVFDYNFRSQVGHIFSKVTYNVVMFAVTYKSHDTSCDTTGHLPTKSLL